MDNFYLTKDEKVFLRKNKSKEEVKEFYKQLNEMRKKSKIKDKETKEERYSKVEKVREERRKFLEGLE